MFGDDLSPRPPFFGSNSLFLPRSLAPFHTLAAFPLFSHRFRSPRSSFASFLRPVLFPLLITVFFRSCFLPPPPLFDFFSLLVFVIFLVHICLSCPSSDSPLPYLTNFPVIPFSVGRLPVALLRCDLLFFFISTHFYSLVCHIRIFLLPSFLFVCNFFALPSPLAPAASASSLRQQRAALTAAAAAEFISGQSPALPLYLLRTHTQTDRHRLSTESMSLRGPGTDGEQ